MYTFERFPAAVQRLVPVLHKTTTFRFFEFSSGLAKRYKSRFTGVREIWIIACEGLGLLGALWRMDEIIT